MSVLYSIRKRGHWTVV